MAKTPKGVFRFTHLNKPDTKFKAEGEYHLTVAFDKDDPKVQALIEKMDAEHEAALKKAQEAWEDVKPAIKKKLKAKKITEPVLMPYYVDEEDDDGPTGNILIRFKTKTQFTSKKTGKTVKKVVPFYDGRGEVIPDKKRPLVYGGTVGAVDFKMVPTFIPAQGEAYLSLYLNSIRILQLVTSGSAGGGWDDDEESDFSADDLDEYDAGDDDEDIDDDLDGDLDDDDVNDSDDDDLDDEIPF